MKNLKRTLTILLCYIFAVMMLPVNVITQIVQASTSDVPDYSNVFENGYVVSALYKNEAILLKGGFNGYAHYKNGEIIKSSSDELLMDMYKGGISNTVEVYLRKSEKIMSYDFNTGKVTDMDLIKEEIENLFLKPYITGKLERTSISVIPTNDEEKWYMINASVIDETNYNWHNYTLIIDESYTNIIDVSNSELYRVEKYGDLFIGSKSYWQDDEYKSTIETISLDGKITNVNISELDGKNYIRRGNIIYTYNEDKIERYEIIDNNLKLINTTKLGDYEEMSSNGKGGNIISTIDANNNFWFIAKENSKVGLYKVNDNNIEKKYLINENFLNGASSLTIYDDNNIVISDFSKEKHAIIQTSKNGWVLQNDKWYYYKSDGKKVTGWLDLNGAWYYFDNNGVMQTGWVNDNGTWYYLNNSGSMVTGWLNDNGTWYYLNNSGSMVTGWLNDNGTWYYFNTSGIMSTGWLNDNGTWYYLNNSGSMLTGWQQIDGTWYYFDNSGIMEIGWLNLGGTWYYLNESGEMQTGWLQLGSTWYYLYDSGVMATNTSIDGWYIDWSGVATPQ